MGRNSLKTVTTLATIGLALMGCSKAAESTSVATPKTLYVAAGRCYSGAGITTYDQTTNSRAVTKWSTETGLFSGVFTDLNVGSNVSVGTTPQKLVDKGDHVLMLTENATTGGDRKIFKIVKSNPGTYITYANDPTAFTAVSTDITRSFAEDADGSFLFSKSRFVERINALGVRIAKGGTNPWVNSNAAAGNCFTAAATQIQDIQVLTPFTDFSQGKLLYTHTGATAALNRIGIIQSAGMTSATPGDCAGSSPATGIIGTPHTNATGITGSVTFSATGPAITSMVYIPTPSPATTTGKLILSYSASVPTAFDNATTLNYGIVMWDITETSASAATITNPVVLYRNELVLWAPSAMAYDATTNSLFVAVGGSPSQMNQTTQNFGYNIEKFTLNLATPSLTRVSVANRPFLEGNAYTKCISTMMIAD